MDYNIAFPQFNLYFNINNIAFSFFGKDIYWYGIIIAFAILLGFFLVKRDNGKFGVKYDDIENFVLIAIPFSIIGARVYYVIFSLDDYRDNIFDIFKIWNGGLAIYGGIIAAIITAIVYCKVKSIRLFDLLDSCVPYLALGQAIGRWGNFVNREAYGSITTSFFRMEILDNYGKYITVHPTFLYESVGLLFIFVFLVCVKRKYSGELVLIYFTGYGLLRFFVESLRTDSLMIGDLKVSMILSAALFLVAVEELIRNKFKKH